MMMAFSTATYGQNIKKQNETDIPILISQNFVNEYPNSKDVKWRGYSEEFLGVDWYDYNLSMNSTKPFQYYVVDFTTEKYQLKAIYEKTGKKIAVEGKIIFKLPTEIPSPFENSNYSGWKITNDMIIIYQNDPSDVTKVYKFRVEKGLLKHDLLYSSEGVLLKDNTIK